MSLKDLEVKPIYKSKDCNVIKEFYIPVLSQSKHYDRVSAYFDSKILSLYASGIEHIYMNGGKIRFIFSYSNGAVLSIIRPYFSVIKFQPFSPASVKSFK